MKEIVKFKNGKYGIRKRDAVDRLFGWKGVFKDLVTDGFWWSQGSRFFRDCQSDDLNSVIEQAQLTKGDFVEKTIKA